MKSHTFADNLIDRCMTHPGTRWACIREVQLTLAQSVKQLLEDKIKAFGLGESGTNDFRILNTHIETPGGGVILFLGMQTYNADNIKSLEGLDGAWVEEAQTLSQRSLDLLRPTIRKEGSEIWFSWNPRNATDPVDKFLRGKDCPEGAVVIFSSYKDNPWFPEVLRKEMEWDKRVDYDKYAHIWLGEYEKHTNARVFKNWRVEPFDTPASAQIRVGADWGYSVDPSTLVRCYESLVDPTTGKEWISPATGTPRKRIYIDYDLFRVGVEIDHLPSFYDGMLCGCDYLHPDIPCKDQNRHAAMRQYEIVADSARPETISYMRRYGYGGMVAAKKGPNSVKEGVLFLQGYDIIIHPRCVHAEEEFRLYSFVVDQVTNEVTNVLADKKNHIIDPVRYAVEQLRGQMRIKKAVWG